MRGVDEFGEKRRRNTGISDKQKESSMRTMKVTNWVHVIAGIFILVSLALGYWVSPWWFWFTAFVGLNLFQYGFSGFCPLAIILRRCGVRGEAA